MEIEARLVVGVRGERLARARRDRRVAREDLLGDAAHRLDAEREREHVEQEDLALAIVRAREDVGLDRRAERDHLVRVDVAERLLAEELRDVLPDVGHARRAAHEDHPVELLRLEARVAERAPADDARALDDGRDEILELFARDGEMDQLFGNGGRDRIDADAGDRVVG